MRLVEYNEGLDGELFSNEIYFYLFDGLMMLVIVVVFLVLYFGRVRMKVWKYMRKGFVEEEV